MKKNRSRILAAAVAIPVALSQIFAISALAIDVPTGTTTIGTTQVLRVPGNTNFPADAADTLAQDGLQTITFEQESVWNETLAGILGNVADGTSVEVAVTDLADVFGNTYFGGILRDVLLQSGNATATYDATAKEVTIEGSLDLSAYLQAELDKVVDENPVYAEYDIDTTLDTTYTSGIDYVVTVGCDFEAGKTITGSAVFNTPNGEYTVTTIADYMDVVYNDLAAQLDAIAEEVAGAKGDATAEKAELKEVTDLLKQKIDQVSDIISKAQNATLRGDKSYATSADAYAALKNWAAEKWPNASNRLPDTADEAFTKYASKFEKAVEIVNNALSQSGANVVLDVTTDDVKAVFDGATDIYATTPDAGVLVAEATIEVDEADAQYDDVVAYISDQDVASQLDMSTLTTAKKVTVTVDVKAGTVDFDVVREVSVTEADPATTTTTSDVDVTTTTESGETTTGSADTTTATGDDTTTTESGETTTGSADTTTATGDDTTTTESGETTTASADTTTATGDDTTTTTEPPVIPPVDEIESVSAEVGESVYFSTDEEFDVSELVFSVVVTLTDGSQVTIDDPASVIEFASTPVEIYNAIEGDEKYYIGGVEISYVDAEGNSMNIAEQPTVGVAMKGDVVMDGKLELDDTMKTLIYYATYSAYGSAQFTDEPDSLLETLTYFVADTDTESKVKGADGSRITLPDMHNILVKYASEHAGLDTTWEEILAD